MNNKEMTQNQKFWNDKLDYVMENGSFKLFEFLPILEYNQPIIIEIAEFGLFGLNLIEKYEFRPTEDNDYPEDLQQYADYQCAGIKYEDTCISASFVKEL